MRAAFAAELGAHRCRVLSTEIPAQDWELAAREPVSQAGQYYVLGVYRGGVMRVEPTPSAASDGVRHRRLTYWERWRYARPPR